MQLYIGNKNYSSWSLRPWLLMKHAGIAFEEKSLRLSWDDDSAFKKTLLSIAPSGRVPLLVDDGFAVWDSLAIAEYLAERFPAKHLWPADAKGAGTSPLALRRDALRLRRHAQCLRHEPRSLAPR